MADTAGNLSSGNLYVYRDEDNETIILDNNEVKIGGLGSWIKIDNATVSDRNKTKQLAADVGATEFVKLEDVEIGPDGRVYFAAAGEEVIYYLEDIEPIPSNPDSIGRVNFLGVYAGGQSYNITKLDGSTYSEDWGIGNDNLAFDNNGNLWVTQDRGKDLIWVVKSGHTQMNPKVEIFAIAPKNGEPTGNYFFSR